MRLVTLKPNTTVPVCPKCGNNTAFKCYSQQVCEDGCELWCTCKCGYTPIKSSLEHVEDVMGGLCDSNCIDAIRFTWSDLINKTI